MERGFGSAVRYPFPGNNSNPVESSGRLDSVHHSGSKSLFSGKGPPILTRGPGPGPRIARGPGPGPRIARGPSPRPLSCFDKFAFVRLLDSTNVFFKDVQVFVVKNKKNHEIKGSDKVPN